MSLVSTSFFFFSARFESVGVATFYVLEDFSSLRVLTNLSFLASNLAALAAFLASFSTKLYQSDFEWNLRSLWVFNLAIGASPLACLFCS
jgi:hypothetical protein